MGKTSEHLPTFQDSFSAVMEGEGEGMSSITDTLTVLFWLNFPGPKLLVILPGEQLMITLVLFKHTTFQV